MVIYKVQAILALNPPNNVKELRHFLEMVQYYWDMWARRSKVLAYLDFLKPFEIYTDAFSMQLGAMITQDNRPIAFFNRKLSPKCNKNTVSQKLNSWP